MTANQTAHEQAQAFVTALNAALPDGVEARIDTVDLARQAASISYRLYGVRLPTTTNFTIEALDVALSQFAADAAVRTIRRMTAEPDVMREAYEDEIARSAVQYPEHADDTRTRLEGKRDAVLAALARFKAEAG